MYALEVSKECDVMQGFNFVATARPIIGWVQQLKIGSLDLAKSLNPPKVKGSGTETCVAIIQSISWGGTPTSPIWITGRIGLKAFAKLNQLRRKKLDDVVSQARFTVWEYDLLGDNYYESFKTDGSKAVKCKVAKERDESLSIFVREQPETDPQSPINFSFTIGLAPAEEVQNLIVATSSTDKDSHPWGFKVK